jgi:hypothetical protein
MSGKGVESTLGGLTRGIEGIGLGMPAKSGSFVSIAAILPRASSNPFSRVFTRCAKRTSEKTKMMNAIVVTANIEPSSQE